MEEKNELNDIILNKSTHNSSNKKLLLAVATLALILIIVVVIMNSLKSEGTNNLPQAVLPPEPATHTDSTLRDDPLFEPVEVVEEESNEDMHLNEIAQKLKKESIQKDEEVIAEEEVIVAPKALIPPAAPVKVQKHTPLKRAKRDKTSHTKVAKTAHKTENVKTGRLYIQVGSFTKFKPSAKLLRKIKAQGYHYSYHEVEVNGRNINKVLIGPFNNKTDLKKARQNIRRTIEPTAFSIKL